MPTPEERAARAFGGVECCLNWPENLRHECVHDTVDPCRVDELCEYHSCLFEIRAAVEAETERCAKVAEGCEVTSTYTDPLGNDQIAAAIRAPAPEPADD